MVDTLNTGGLIRRSPVRHPRWRLAALALVVLLALGGLVQAVHIHHQDGQWALVPSVAPDRLTVDGRDYRRGDLDKQPRDWVKRGTTSGGGTIYTPAGFNGTPTVLWVRKGNKVWGYDLIGGP